METELDPSDFESLTSKQKEALLLTLMAACARGTYTLEPAGIMRFKKAASQLPMVLNPLAVEALLEEGKLRYDSVDDDEFGVWFNELATRLADSALRENIVVAMNNAAVGGAEPFSPSDEQKDTLLCGLLLACAGGSTLDEQGIQRFRDAAAKLPDVVDSQALQERLSSANDSYDASSPPNVGLWLSQIAALVQDAKLREKTLAAIGHASVEAENEAVPWFFDHVQLAFGIDAARMALLRQVKRISSPMRLSLIGGG